jgi:HEAT repeat protein
VLRDLAREAGFEVAIGVGGQPSGHVTLRTVEVPVERALARLLKGLPYTLRYEADAEGEEGALARVELGEVKLAAAEPREPKREPSRPERKSASRKREREPDPARADELLAENLREIEDPDPEVRIAAAGVLYPKGDALPALAGLVREDPDPGVRVAAAESLGYSMEDPEALSALMYALRDPEPQVVIAALDAIEFVGNPSVIPELGFLLDHPDSQVRDAAGEAIDWLEE